MLQPRPDYGGDKGREWETAAIERGLLCAECKSRLPGTAGLPADVQVWEPVTPTPFGDIISVCLYARVAFVEALEDVEGSLVSNFGIGKLILPNGKVDERYETLSPARGIAIRGAGASGLGCCCIACRQFHYFPMPWESRHLVRGTFDESQRLHATQVGVLVAHTEIWERIPQVFKKKIKAWPLPVKDEPEDGITDFPPVWPW